MILNIIEMNIITTVMKFGLDRTSFEPFIRIPKAIDNLYEKQKLLCTLISIETGTLWT